MPAFKDSKRWSVVVFPLYKQSRILKLLQRISPLFPGTTPAAFLSEGIYTRPEMPKVVVVVFQPFQQLNPETLVSRACRVLESKHNLLLDWTAGTSGKKVYLVIKTIAVSQQTGKDKFFKITKEDIEDLRKLVPKKNRLRKRVVCREE